MGFCGQIVSAVTLIVSISGMFLLVQSDDGVPSYGNLFQDMIFLTFVRRKTCVLKSVFSIKTIFDTIFFFFLCDIDLMFYHFSERSR